VKKSVSAYRRHRDESYGTCILPLGSRLPRVLRTSAPIISHLGWLTHDVLCRRTVQQRSLVCLASLIPPAPVGQRRSGDWRVLGERGGVGRAHFRSLGAGLPAAVSVGVDTGHGLVLTIPKC